MAKALADWLETDVYPVRDKPLGWLSANHFFRDPNRPNYVDPDYFFAPADGIIVYQRTVDPDEPLVMIKGCAFSLREAIRDPYYESRSLVIGIFMTMFDVHVNRVPYSGRLSYRELDRVDTFNHPMLDVEKSILQDLCIATDSMQYLRHNQRVLSRVYSVTLGQAYYVLQIADFDVDCITPFDLKQNQAVSQGQRFSQIRFGSQVDLIIPESARFDFETVQPVGCHVEAGIDPLVRIREKHAPTAS